MFHEATGVSFAVDNANIADMRERQAPVITLPVLMAAFLVERKR